MGLTGHLRLTCGLDVRGESAIKRQSFQAPLHLSKPHWEEGTVVVNVVNPTAGYFSGDRVECTVDVENGGRLLVTTPSATRVYQNRGGAAKVRQTLRVEDGGFLDWNPEFLIAQKGARFEQRTEIAVGSGGELLFHEAMAPGRSAFGEVHAFERVEWETRLEVGGRVALQERAVLTPEYETVRALRAIYSTPYYGSWIAYSPHLDARGVCARIHSFHGEEAWVGCSRLGDRSLVIRVIAGSAPALRLTSKRIRACLYESLNRTLPELRRAEPIG